nr:hypothetical protein CFP56_56940 [Quercus suber]
MLGVVRDGETGEKVLAKKWIVKGRGCRARGAVMSNKEALRLRKNYARGQGRIMIEMGASKARVVDADGVVVDAEEEEEERVHGTRLLGRKRSRGVSVAGELSDYKEIECRPEMMQNRVGGASGHVPGNMMLQEENGGRSSRRRRMEGERSSHASRIDGWRNEAGRVRCSGPVGCAATRTRSRRR